MFEEEFPHPSLSLSLSLALTLSRTQALGMASGSQDLLGKLESLGLQAQASAYLPVFQGKIDMQATVNLHRDGFQEYLDYLEQHVRTYAVQLPNSTNTWVPIDFIKFIYGNSKNFKQRLMRFVKKFTTRDYRQEDDDVVMDLDKGPLGNFFLSWDMTLAFMLQEGQISGGSRTAAQPATVEASLVHEEQVEVEENLTEQEEASLALILLQHGLVEEEPDRLLAPEEVLQELPEADVLMLNPIIIDGDEYLFLDDLEKLLGLREDEALSVLANTTAWKDGNNPDNEGPKTAVDFEDHDLTKALAFKGYNVDKTIEENVTSSLVAIGASSSFYDSIPDSAFQPPKRLCISGEGNEGGTFDISRQQVIEYDKDDQVNFMSIHGQNLN